MVTTNSINSFAQLGSSLITYSIYGVVGLIILIILGIIGYSFWKKKKWNLKVGIKIPRSDGRLINHEFAKGNYNINEGIVDIKRKGMRAAGMKPFDVREYLQGNSYLEVMQIGANEFIPLKPDSFKVIHSKDLEGNDIQTAIMKIKADTQKRKTWKDYFERTAKRRFTLKNFMDEYGKYLAFGMIIFVIFLGFAIVWIRMPSICGA